MLEVMLSEAIRKRTPCLLFQNAGMALGAEPGRHPSKILDAYRGTLDDRGAVEAMCEEYRAGASVEVERDDADRSAGRQITCPVLVLRAARGGLPRFYPDVLEVWRPSAPDVRGRGSTPRTSWHSIQRDGATGSDAR